MEIRLMPSPEIEYIDPKDCKWHDYVPSFDTPTTWSCVCCNTPGDPEKYEEYQDTFRRSQLRDYIWDCVIPSDPEDRDEFLSEVMSLLTLEQLNELLPEREQWWEY